TLLYNAKDLALAYQKEKDHHPVRSIYVIDTRQSLAMQHLFKTLKLNGFKKELQHLSYEFVTLKDGAMSSRQGNIVRYEEFRDALIEISQKETKKRHPDWTQKKVDQTARAIAFSAMRFGMLKQE
ncbi:arginine--tRNA ligase, partial [Patescibacteria group bacterium]